MPLMTMACTHYHYAECTSRHCECECHKPKDTPSKTTVLREEAHQAVKVFDRKPDWDNTCLAILALEEYQDALRRGRTLSREEVADFAKRWDARVEAGQAQP